MGDFFAPNPGGSGGYVPPEPDIPAPHFETVGAQISSGFKVSGWIEAAWDYFFKKLHEWLVAAIAGMIKAVFFLVTLMMKTMHQIDEKTDDSYAQAIVATLEHLFDVDVNPADVSGRGQGAQRVVLAQNMGKAILGALFSEAPQAGAGGLRPSSAAGEAYLWRVMHLGLEGWIESWLADALSYHELEKFGDLKDIVERMLGLGRLSRQVLAPALKVLIHDPWLWQLNNTYRPTLLPHELACRQFLRGEITRDKLDEVLGWQGWSAQNIDVLLNNARRFLSETDVDYAMRRGVWSEDQAAKYLQQQGWELTDAQTVVSLLVDKRIDPYRKEMLQVSIAAYERGDMDITTLQSAVTASGLPDSDQQWLLKVAALKRETNVKHLSIGQVEQMVRKGLMNVDDLRTWMQRENYPLQEIQFLELLLIEEVNTATSAAAARKAKAEAALKATEARQAAAAQKQQAAAARLESKGVSLAEAKQLVQDGQWTFDQYAAFLASYGVAADHIPELLTLLHEQIDAVQAKRAAAGNKKALTIEKEIPIGRMEAGVKAGVITMDDFRRYLADQQYGPEDIDNLVAVLQAELDAAKTKASAKTAAGAKAAAKSITLHELEHAVRLGLAPIDTYKAALVAAGEDAASIDLLVHILQQQIATDTAAAARRKDVALKAGLQGVSLSQLEAAVVDGLKPISAYAQQLSLLGYSHEDVTTLTDLVQLKVNHQKLVQAKQAAAEAKAAATGLSIGEIDRATKLGVLSIDQYTALLSKFGLDATDQAILRASMVAEIQRTAKTQQKAAAVTTRLATKKLSLSELEAAVRAGVSTVADYEQTLMGEGYTAADAAELGQLLTLKLQQEKATAATKAAAQARAADKDPSLSKIEAMVKAHIVTMDDYGAYLAEIGMDAADVALMQALLQSQIDAAAKKAAAKTQKSAAAAGTVAPPPV